MTETRDETGRSEDQKVTRRDETKATKRSGDQEFLFGFGE
jgi:hypothetical protein